MTPLPHSAASYAMQAEQVLDAAPNQEPEHLLARAQVLATLALAAALAGRLDVDVRR